VVVDVDAWSVMILLKKKDKITKVCEENDFIEKKR
jgi:hypothetical protein